MPEFHRCNRA